VRFKITVAELRFFLVDRLAAFEQIWEPGQFSIQVGANSQALSTNCVEWRADE
jgi:hypothetical protein